MCKNSAVIISYSNANIHTKSRIWKELEHTNI